MNLKTIAGLAGVSTATVSNVINGNYHKVSEETRRKIEAIIRENNYKPNAVARSLASKESRIIGLVVPYVKNEEDCLSNPYNMHIIAKIEKYVRMHDYYLMFRCVLDPVDIIPFLSSWNVDGAIFSGAMTEDAEKILQENEIPSVFLDSYDTSGRIVNVGIDDYRGGYLAAKYLIGKGHRELALVTPGFTGHGVISERHQGFLDACRDSGIDLPENHIFYTRSTTHEGARILAQDIAMCGQKITAVSALSDVTAYGIIEGLQQCGLRVPTDISVTGFDNLALSEYITPKLTTIAQPIDLKAKTAVETLFKLMNGENDFERTIKLPVQICERNSVREI